MATPHSNELLPVLIAGDTFRLDIQIEDPLQNTLTWALFVNGQELDTATNGVNLGSGMWRFDVAVPQTATPGKSARVRITATVDSSPWTRDLHSLVAAPVKLIEREKSYRYTQNAVDDIGKTADVTVSGPV